MGAVTGKGLAALIREKFSLKVTAFAMLALLVANFGTTVAEFSGVAAAFSLAHIPPWLAVPPVAVGVWLLVTRGNYRKVERVFLALTAVYVAYFVAGVLAQARLGRRASTARSCRRPSSTACGCSRRSPPSARRSRPGASSSSRPTSSTSASRSATTCTPRSRSTSARCSPTPSTSSSSWPAPRRCTSPASSSRPRRTRPGRSRRSPAGPRRCSSASAS